MATTGQKPWPSAGCFVAAYGQFFMAADNEYLTDLEDAFAADAAVDAFEAAGRRSRPLAALEAKIDR